MTITHTEFAVPSGREEQWRFTPLERLRGLHDDAPFDGTALIEWDAADCSVEQVPVAALSYGPVDRVSERAWSSVERAVVVTIPRERTRGDSVVLRISCDGRNAAGHIRVIAEPFSTATVILEHSGSGAYVGNVDVLVGDGADLTLVSEQVWNADAVHLGHHHARLGRDARFRSVVVTLNGDLIRLVPTVEFAAPGGDVELLGVFLAGAGQHVEHRLFVDHSEPHCRSRVAYKGALEGVGAHSVWIGDVLVRKTAVGTDTYELNRNLLLSDGARADSVPNLELETGEVAGAGHASATGRFDDDQLFYLQARGIPEDIARMLVVRGFFADVLQRAGDARLHQDLLVAVDARLESLGMARLDLAAVELGEDA